MHLYLVLQRTIMADTQEPQIGKDQEVGALKLGVLRPFLALKPAFIEAFSSN